MAANENSKTNPAPVVMKVNSPTGVNFRTGPVTAEDNIIKVLKDGAKVAVMEIDDGWAAAKHGKADGYIMAEFLVEV